MKRVLKWFGYAIAGLIGLAVVAAAGIFILSGQILNKRYEAKAEALPAPTRAELLDAERQARIHGCIACHGENVSGRVMADIPNVARLVAPNLTAVAAKASDQQLAAAIRQGIGHDGRGLFIMPSQQFSRLNATEVAALIRWVRTRPRVSGNVEPITMRPLGRVAIAIGKIEPAPAMIDDFQTQTPIDLGPRYAQGQRLAAANCSECHGPSLYGGAVAGTKAPDLAIAGAYDLNQFRTLMKTGRPPSGKDLGLMKEIAEKDFSHLRDDEVQALHEYLTRRAEKLSN